MALESGTRLGSYEVLAAIGVGGMGEVYRARDTRLNRDVALKVLPDAFTLDSDRLARFRREAQLLASLNHPNIAAIYGFEDSNGVQTLVLELVEGPTLAERLSRGAISVDEALPIARQIAEALESAHEVGIVHRDLKPSNIKLKVRGDAKPSASDITDCTVKVLDFGLAKALEPMVDSSGTVLSSPTITSPALTQIGVVLGTAAYMSPEQAKGRPADKRSDVWAFGAVLFEMLSGERPFKGDDVADTLAAVLRAEPEWSALPGNTPHAVRRLLRRCLQKDPKRRLQHMGDVRLELVEVEEGDPLHKETACRAVAPAHLAACGGCGSGCSGHRSRGVSSAPSARDSSADTVHSADPHDSEPYRARRRRRLFPGWTNAGPWGRRSVSRAREAAARRCDSRAIARWRRRGVAFLLAEGRLDRLFRWRKVEEGSFGWRRSYRHL